MQMLLIAGFFSVAGSHTHSLLGQSWAPWSPTLWLPISRLLPPTSPALTSSYLDISFYLPSLQAVLHSPFLLRLALFSFPFHPPSTDWFFPLAKFSSTRKITRKSSCIFVAAWSCSKHCKIFQMVNQLWLELAKPPFPWSPWLHCLKPIVLQGPK